MQRHDIAPDAQMLIRVIDSVYALGAAYYFTRQEAYAVRCTQKLDVFFLSPSTGMLPSLKYAGMTPGVSDVGLPMVRCCCTGTYGSHQWKRWPFT